MESSRHMFTIKTHFFFCSLLLTLRAGVGARQGQMNILMYSLFVPSRLLLKSPLNPAFLAPNGSLYFCFYALGETD